MTKWIDKLFGFSNLNDSEFQNEIDDIFKDVDAEMANLANKTRETIDRIDERIKSSKTSRLDIDNFITNKTDNENKIIDSDDLEASEDEEDILCELLEDFNEESFDEDDFDDDNEIINCDDTFIDDYGFDSQNQQELLSQEELTDLIDRLCKERDELKLQFKNARSDKQRREIADKMKGLLTQITFYK